MIKICENCSCVIIDRLKELVGKENVQVGCVGSCVMNSKFLKVNCCYCV